MKKIELTPYQIKGLRELLKHLFLNERLSNICPHDGDHECGPNDEDETIFNIDPKTLCWTAFPRVSATGNCPCYCYTEEHISRVLMRLTEQYINPK